MADAAQLGARFVEQLGGERTGAHARTIGLEDAVDLADAVGRDAQSGADAGADGIGRRDERIRPEIDVEQRPLRALGEHAFAGDERIVDEILAVDQPETPEVIDGLEPLTLQVGDVVGITEPLQNLLVAGLGAGIDRLEIGAQQIAHAHAVAADLVGVGGTDALAGGADPVAALGSLVSGIEDSMRGKNEVRLLGDAELAGEIVAALGQLLGLGPEQDGIDDHTVADDIGLATLENPRRNRAQDVLLTVELKRMAGIGTALETRYDLVAGRQYIHDLALALVAPLQTEDHVDFFHYELMTVFLDAKDVFCIQRYKKPFAKTNEIRFYRGRILQTGE